MGTPLIFQISHYSILIAFLASLIYFSYLSTPVKYLAGLMIIGTFTEFASTAISGSNHWIMNLYDVVEFVFIMAIFYKYNDVLKSKKILLSIMGIFVLSRIILLTTNIESIFDFKSYMQIFGNLLMISLAILSLNIHKKENIDCNTDSKFWILSGILLYISASFVVTIPILIWGNAVIIKIYFIHAYANITTNLIFAYAFFIEFRQNRPDSSKLVRNIS
ncbi:MAG: hypothetical protein ACEPO8_09205 [Rhodothermaceae bacterium]